MKLQSFTWGKTPAFKPSFVSEAQELFPNSKELHEAIERGSGMTGMILSDLLDTEPMEFGYAEILNAGSLDELKRKATVFKRKANLYQQFIEGSCYCA